MNLEKLKQFWLQEEKASFKGWDFSYINDRVKEEPLPWDYKKIVKSYISEGKVLLDMGTGGGEFLLSLNPTGGKTYATESYPPNIELSKNTLAPFGIEVRAVNDDKHLPFDDNMFDIVINRHESFCLTEVRRILKPEGIFITQQVGGSNNSEISKFLLGSYPYIGGFNFNLENTLREVEDSGFEIIDSGEHFPKSYFYDVGALVFFAKIIEWEFPDFSVEKCFDRLLKLHEKVENNGFVEAQEHRFLIVARNNK